MVSEQPIRLEPATEADVPVILALIRELAEYEWTVFRLTGDALTAAMSRPS